MQKTNWQPSNSKLMARHRQREIIKEFLEIIPPGMDFEEALLALISHYMQVDPYDIERVIVEHLD